MTDSILRFARRGLCAILIACMPLAAFAALSADDLAPLAADDFDAKSAAIDKLIANADAPSIAVLSALADGSLVATDAGVRVDALELGLVDHRTDVDVRIQPIAEAQRFNVGPQLTNAFDTTIDSLSPISFCSALATADRKIFSTTFDA